MTEAPISAERYLRRLVERVVDPQDPERPGLTELRAAAEALVAAAQASPALAGELLADARLALTIRGRTPGAGGFDEQRRPVAGVPAPAPRAVAPGPVRFERPDGAVTVTAVTWGPDGADVHLWGSPATEERPPPLPGPSSAAGRARRSPGPAASRGTSAPRRLTPPDPVAGAPRALRPPLFASLPARRIGSKLQMVHTTLGDLRVTDPGEGVVGSVHATGAPYVGERWMLTAPLDPPPETGVPWVDVKLGEGRARLEVTSPGPIVDGRRHGRSAGSVWVLGRLLARAAELPGESFGPIVPAVEALVAVGELDPTDPLVHQAGLLDGRIPTGPGDPALDPRWQSPLTRAGAPAAAEGVWALATTVDLGAHVVRLDALVADDTGAVLHGACVATGAWPPATPLVLSAFDNDHNWYTLTPLWSGNAADEDSPLVTWQLQPALDPSATTLRLDVTSVEREASVEVRLR